MIGAALAAGVRVLIGATAQWHCPPTSDRQRIYFANHSSHLDFVVIWSALPAAARPFVRPVAGKDYWDKGIVRRYVSNHVFHAILIERRNAGHGDAVAAARASIEAMAHEMGDRYSLIVFPEGTRSQSGRVGPFKSGLYHLARLRPDVELIPVHLENLNRVLPKGESLPVPMLCRLVFGEPLVTHVDEEKNAFLERARDAVIRLGAA